MFVDPSGAGVTGGVGCVASDLEYVPHSWSVSRSRMMGNSTEPDRDWVLRWEPSTLSLVADVVTPKLPLIAARMRPVARTPKVWLSRLWEAPVLSLKWLC